MRHARMWTAVGVALLARATLAAPVIEHTPVDVGVRGQPLMIRARVDGRGRPVKSVTLFYSTAKDAAPFSVPMQSGGAQTWVGTIPGGVSAALSQLSYYIAAEDDRGATAETPWYVVKLQEPTATGAPASQPAWVKPALIGGGVLAAGSIAAAVIAANSGGDGGSGGPSPGDLAGQYIGTVTRCQALSGAPPSCESHGCTIRIATDGTVSSSDLHPGQSMQTRLSGQNFVLTAIVRAPGRDGEVRYIGTVVGTRIVGTVEGSAGTGTNTVVYSGTFSAVKQ